MIVKVKEPQASEVAILEPRHVLFTYLHLAPDPELTQGLIDSGATCIAYETVEDDRGRLPLLAPMSEVAGKIATQAGAFMLEKPLGGRGLLLGGVPGVAAGKVLVIGGGVVGMNAAIIALGMQAETYVFDRNLDRLRELESVLNWRASTVFASTLAIEEHLPTADLVIGAVLVHGAKAPHVVTREQLGLMQRHAVLVDVSIDQGGCFETSRPTTNPPSICGEIETGDGAGLRFRSCDRRRVFGVNRVEDAVARVVRIEHDVDQAHGEVALEREPLVQPGTPAEAIEVQVRRELLCRLVEDVERAVEVVEEEAPAARLLAHEVDPRELGAGVVAVGSAVIGILHVLGEFQFRPDCRGTSVVGATVTSPFASARR